MPAIEAAAAFRSATQALSVGDRKAALSGLLMAVALEPENPAYRRAALDILSVTVGYQSLPTPVLQALRQCATDPTLDLQPLSLVVKTIFEADPRFADMERLLDAPPIEIESAIASGAWDWFFNEPMLLGVLARATLIGVRLERVMTLLRRHTMMHSPSALHPSFLAALILQLNTARFAWVVTDAERDALKSANTPLIQALYQPLLALDDAATAQLPDVLRATRSSLMARRERASAIAHLTDIDDRTSQAVQGQYESFPYPPWDALGPIQTTTLSKFVAARFPGAASANARARILSAGCGTGRGAVMLALTFPDASVTALDLSRASLAYASLKAEQHSVKNISFGVGDILKVADIGTAFDLIESSGVLHHMADPAAGLRALSHVLKPNGLMRFALYSERGRGAVIAARAIITQHNIPDSDDGVRQARQILQDLPTAHPARGVIDTPEFFTLDGLHDLIFNVQESRYSPRSLKALLSAAGLNFLGFDIDDPSVKQKYATLFPSDPHACDLDNWDIFEQNHPGTFAEMYQLWCHRSDAGR